MNRWNTRAALSRLEKTRDHEQALMQLAHDLLSRRLRPGPGLEIPAANGELVSEILDDSRRPDNPLLGRMGGHIWQARSDGEGRTDLRTLDLPPGRTQFAMVTTVLYERHRNNPVYPRCGERTILDRAETARHYPKCDRELLPRTDPAVILAVTDPVDRLLFTHAQGWPGNHISVQAGFIEAGESAEQAYHREIREETGLAIRNLGSFGTQPWPFPRSLMPGFEARTDGTEPNLDGEELSWNSFHTRKELRRAVMEGELAPPEPVSPARQLTEAQPVRGGQDDSL